ncbi:MAG: hypothetical protein GYA57_05255 [Myxococcales bacterium]|nr:hypothetical protein [Myxococcales bacterium]
MEGFSVLFTLIAVGIALVGWRMVRRARENRWRAYAQRRGLHSRLVGRFRLFGVFERTVVALDEERRGSGKSRYTVTKASAFFGLPMPEGLLVTFEGVGADLAIAFGGQDIQVGHPEVDRLLRIQGSDEEAVRALFDRPRARRTIAEFVPVEPEGRVCQGSVSFIQRGFVDSPEMLDAMLHRVAEVVRAVEADLAVDPAADARDPRAAVREVYPVPAEWLAPPGEPATGPDATPRPPVNAPPADDGAAPPPPGVDAIVAELAAGGRVESAGSFTLDREAARAKLAEFRLRDPDEYVLALVRSAVLKGAARIDLELDADDLKVRFDGRPFRLVDFEELYGAMFVGGEDHDLRARRQLALGVTAAGATRPRFVRVVSGAGADAVELTLAPGEPDRYGPAEAATEGTTIHVKSRLLEALGGRRGRLAEMIERRCAFAPCPVTLNGKSVSRGLDPPGAWGVVRLEGPGYSARVGLRPGEGLRQEIVWLLDGVVAARHERDGWPRELTAVVDGSGKLRLDASEGDIVRDAAYAELLETVRGALPRVYRRLGEQITHLDEHPGLPRAWAAAVLRSVLRGFPDPAAFAPGGPGRWLAELPLFQAIDLTAVSLAELLDHAAKGRAGRADYAAAGLGIDQASAPFRELAGRKIVWVGWRHDVRHRAFLHRVFGDRLPCVNDRLLDCPRHADLLERITM